MGDGRSRASLLTRVVQIFEVFGPDETAVRVTDIAARTGLHIATVSRLVNELVDHGLLARGPDRKVRIGVRMWELATRASPTLTLRDAALPFMEDVHAIVGNHVHLGVLDGDDVLFIERLSARRAAVAYANLAGRVPLTDSSCGLVLLAYGDRAREEAVLAVDPPSYRSAVMTTPDDLRAELERIRDDGYALLRGHVNRESLAIAVPVRDGSGTVVGALGVVLPIDTSGTSEVQLLLAASRGITRALVANPLERRLAAARSHLVD